jgi:sulfur-oxidizing protein SoxB
MQVLAVASVAGMGLGTKLCWQPMRDRGQQAVRHAHASATCFLHITDCHAQLMPIYFREPNVNLGVGDIMAGKVPHLVGEHLLKAAQHPARHGRGACLHVPRL